MLKVAVCLGTGWRLWEAFDGCSH